MGACHSTKAVIEFEDKPIQRQPQVQHDEQKPHSAPIKTPELQFGLPVIKYDLGSRGLNGRVFDAEEQAFLMQVRYSPASIDSRDVPIEFPLKLDRRFDVETFVNLCKVLKVCVSSYTMCPIDG